jgi:serine/threonine-protein kinase
MDFVRKEDALTPVPPASPEAPEMAARYQVSRLHARGGLGEVYRARDQELSRMVALKRLPQQYARYGELRERFRREAEITACLEHPGIVPVYGMVEDDQGRPCYAMRFIEGETLHNAVTVYFQTLGDDARKRRDYARQTEFRKLLHRLIDVCNTVAYAHSRGVIHRDIKPQNIMLGQFGETLLVDWGLAKRLTPPTSRDTVTVAIHAMDTARMRPPDAPTPPDFQVVDAPLSDSSDVSLTLLPPPQEAPKPTPAPLTQMGQAVGTPQYMSPEQAAGELQVGPASDIYNLGATLYFVLTGKPPFTAQNWTTVQHQICTSTFPRPRQVRRDVPPALEAICLKAMAAKPEDRYASSLDLAADLENWLAHEPVSAWPEPLLMRTRRWLFRHRTLVACFVLFCCSALVVSLSMYLAEKNYTNKQQVTLGQLRKEKDQKDAVLKLKQRAYELLQIEQAKLQIEQERTQKALREKEKKHRAAQDALDKAIVLLCEPLFTQQRFLKKEHRDFLEQLSRNYQEVAADSGGGFYVRRNAAEATWKVASIQHRIGHQKEAEDGLLLAKTQYHQLLKEMPGAFCCRYALGQINDELGRLYSALGRWEAAKDAHGESLRFLRGLVHSTNNDPGYQQWLASALHNYGLTLDELQRHEEADKLFKEAGTIREQLAAKYPDSNNKRLLAAHYVNLGRLLGNRKKYAEAAEQVRKAKPIFVEFVKEQADREAYHALVVCLYDLGHYLTHLEKWEEADEAYRDAIVVQEPLYLKYRSDAGYALQLARLYVNRAGLKRQAGAVKDALTLTDLAIQVIKPLQAREAYSKQTQACIRDAYDERALANIRLGKHGAASVDAAVALSFAEEGKKAEYEAVLGHALVGAGRWQEAYRLAAKVLQEKELEPRVTYSLACTFAQLSRLFPDTMAVRDLFAHKAVELLRKGEEQQLFSSSFMRMQLGTDRDLDGIRQHPEFRKFCERVLGPGWLVLND